MELQLGLSLPVTHNHDHAKRFDLYSCDELKYLDKKRSFDDACGGNTAKQTLPLLLWNGQPNEDDGRGDRNGISCKLFNSKEKGDGDEDEVVGWPPIKSWRKKFLQDQQHHFGHDQGGHREVLANPRIMAANNGGPDSVTFSMYVKVKMEGVAITRKINLSLYNSYHTLTNTLITMFENYSSCNGDKFHCDRHYTLTYQDKDGDWLLAGDVPWQNFIRSVRRLEIVKNG